MQWKKTTNGSGRTVYQYVKDDNDEWPLGGVIDYWPGDPRYKAVCCWVSQGAEWFNELDEAKEHIEGSLVLAKLGENK